MAVSQHTEIRPKFTWLFLGKPKDTDWLCNPVTFRAEADTEEQARAIYPGWDLTFAAKIRTDCPVTCHWMDQDSFVLWSVHGSQHNPKALVEHFENLRGGASWLIHRCRLA